MFYIAFDGFDLFGLHFETREDAQKHLDDNYMKLARHCQYQVAVQKKLTDKQIIKFSDFNHKDSV